MKHLPTSDFLRDLARRVDADYDRERLEIVADQIDAETSRDAFAINAARARLDALGQPAPGSTMGLAGATITHRPDLAYAETALRKAETAGHGGFAGHRPASVQEAQAAMQGDADRGGYLPAQRAAAAIAPAAGPSTHVIPGNAGTIQAPTPLHAAEPAKIGTETR